tara:strand:- start:3095 stop:4012 length:918 start_codon:yes stop_codon:yes gene_type:complete
MISTINKYYNHVNFFTLISLLAIAVNFLFDFSNSNTIINIFAFTLIATLGITHGSYDIKKGQMITKFFNFKSIKLFLILYILVALSIMTSWYILPNITLLIFLLISVYHFGNEEFEFFNINTNFIISIFRGLMIIIAPLILHFEQTLYIFQSINLNINDKLIYFMSDNYTLLFTFASINVLFSLFTINNIRNRFILLLDLLTLILINTIFEPFFAFSLYFCFLHSKRNISKIRKYFMSLNSTNFGSVNLISIITFILFFISLIFLINENQITFSINNTVFIGLAALTFPHILTEFTFNKIIKERI